MSIFLLILLTLGSASLLCAFVIISAAIVSSRSTRRMGGKQMADLAEEAQALRSLRLAAQQKEDRATRMALQ